MTLRLRRIVQVAAVACLVTLLVAPTAHGQVGRSAGRFEHDEHATFQCAECHSTGAATTVANREWCADCHHVNASFSQCRQCHTVREIAPEPQRALVNFRLPPAKVIQRSLLFDHIVHGSVGCASCHTAGAALLAQADCASCHVDHHKAGADCLACHAEPAVTAHPEEVHLDLAGCGTAGCHAAEGINYAAMVDERNLCLSCHVAQLDHEQPEPCAECHILGGGSMSTRETP